MRKVLKIALGWLVLMTLMPFGRAQELPLEIRLFSSLQQQSQVKVASAAGGWNVGGQIGYLFGEKLSGNFRISFDQMSLEEDSVLLEWDWPYWDERYIDWLLTGASQAEVDSISLIREYWRGDSTYHGVFNPFQSLQEVKFSLGLQYHQPITQRLSIYGELGFGFSKFERRLKMVEDWWKSFSWSWDSTKIANGEYSETEMYKYETLQALYEEDSKTYSRSVDEDGVIKFEYDFYARVTHFAPSRRGTRIFWTPVLGLRYQIARYVDLDFAYHGVWYMDGSIVDKIEKFFNISRSSRKWFPFESKSVISIGLTFKY
jgi:opacity protein-like surface antigen